MGQRRSLRKAPLLRRPAWSYALAAALVAAAILSLLLLTSGRSLPPDAGEATIVYATGAGEMRRVRLPDGSSVVLSGDSLLVLAFADAQRRMTLTRGRGRFSVAHEARPFVVVAGGAEIVARGTRFEVDVAGDRARIALIEGAVDVLYARARASGGGRHAVRLRPGETLNIGRGSEPAALAVAGGKAGGGMLQFDQTPLAEVIARVNAAGGPQIRLGDARLGALRVSGGFRVGDGEELVRALKAAFHLRAERHPEGGYLLLPGGPAELKKFGG
ncbi:MAG TPA: FecR domain-containing protein [Allosphingosinicella sp.]